MKKISIQFFVIFSVIQLVSSCASREKIVYFQDIEGEELNDSILRSESTLQIGDILYINISSTDGDAAMPFNLYEVPTIGIETSSAEPITFLVNSEGDINFPVLGKVKVRGLTTLELTSKFEHILEEYIVSPIINIRLINFKVSVLGEVKLPGSYKIDNGRISIVEALTLAGDLTIYGNRESIMLIREKDGKREFTNIDLTDKRLFDSPKYYLKQNDILYVSPNKTRVNSSKIGPSTAIIVSSASLLLVVVGLFIK